MTPPNFQHARKKWLLDLIYSEGYCCLHGYLRLCRARDEAVKDMAENIGLSKLALWYHYRELKQNRRPCMQKSDCLLPIIEEIENASRPSSSEGANNPTPQVRNDDGST